MISIKLAGYLRENRDEVMQRWLENLHGHIAEDFEQMLKTPMGSGVSNKLLNCAIEYLQAEDYQKAEVAHKIRDIASDAAFRRTAVGFGLPDIVETALAFRHALEGTILCHALHGSIEDERVIIEGMMALNELGDILVSGEIAGFFAFNDFRENEEGVA